MEHDEAYATVARLAGKPVRKPDPKKLDQLYRSLPRMKCAGKCASACGPVPLAPLERERIEKRGVEWNAGWQVTLPDGQAAGTTCPALDREELVCTVYADRPMVCRVWGMIRALECPWGCVPEGGHLDDIEGLRLVNLALWYGGSASAVEPGVWDAWAARPDVRRALLAHVEKPVKEEARIVQGTVRVRPGL